MVVYSPATRNREMSIQLDVVHSIFDLDAPLLDHIFKYLTFRELGYASMVCDAWKDIAYAPHLWRQFDGWKGFSSKTTLRSIFNQPRFAQLERLGLKPWNGNFSKFMTVVNSPTLAPKITTLDLTGCTQCKVFRMLQFLPNLHTLILGRAATTPPEAEAVARLPGLRTLDCSKGGRSVKYRRNLFYEWCKAPIWVGDMVQLTSLNLTGCRITDTYVTCHLAGLTNLQDLSLGLNESLTGSSLVALPTSIQHLDLSGCTLIGDEAMLAVAATLCNLRSLDISGCPEVTDKGLSYLATLHTLQILRIFGNSPKISESGLKQLHAHVCLRQHTSLAGIQPVVKKPRGTPLAANGVYLD